MKLKDYKKEYVFIKLSGDDEYKLIPTEEVEEYIKENELVFVKVYGIEKSSWMDNIEDEIKAFILDDADCAGINAEEVLDFEDENFKQGIKYLRKFIDEVTQHIYDVDFDVEIELGDDEYVEM